MRCMFRYVVPKTDRVTEIRLSHSPVHVAASAENEVEFWAEYTEGAPDVIWRFQVFGTGDALPDNAQWVGTCPRTRFGYVWHLYVLGMSGDSAAI